MTQSDLPTESGEPHSGAARASTATPREELPAAVGRYRVLKQLGTGGFGTVYLTQDTELDRLVAVKVPHPERIARAGEEQRYIDEARIVARLDHPAIVPVYDVGRGDDGRIFVVSKYIAGSDLAHWLKQQRPGAARAARWIVTIAEALHYAHTKGLVHRDIKPANLLLDASERVYVTDLGLALREEDYGRPSGRGRAGTPAYMSPEQARGEGHRVDGRSDIFSLGVVLYEMLAGRRPFVGGDRAELLELIIAGEPRPLRQLDDSIPKDLERICFKALSKRASERYSTALDLAEDLRGFLTAAAAAVPGASDAVRVTRSGDSRDGVPPSGDGKATSGDAPPLRVVPKGLRSFDLADADFFLELLPGPRDREGLPESVRFWKTRLEEREPDRTFAVGALCGPSGSGKSSLVKAGLLPRVARHVTFVYVEATAGQLESRLLHGLESRWPDLPVEQGLADALAVLRRRLSVGNDQKAVLVIDQFEQWLHGQADIEASPLAQALRQCDGGHVQCLLLVRDDFWVGLSRFMHEVEVPLAEGVNLATVDLFDLRHAKRVLAAFGRAYGWLPEDKQALTRPQDSFLEQAVTDLAHDGKVVPVRLALFAEMAKSRPWVPATLKDLGGAAGVGARFLEETFAAAGAPPRYRRHQPGARAVLGALLPDRSTVIKGNLRTLDELQDAAGLKRRPREFDELMRILDGELRLITPADLSDGDFDAGAAASVAPSPAGPRSYQLTHDYLVPAVREWLTRQQQETRRGRAELRLADRASWWEAKPEDRHLPSWWEYLSIRLLTPAGRWTEPQRQLMRRAGRYHGLRVGLALAAVAVLLWGGLTLRDRSAVNALYEQLQTATTSAVPQVLARLDDYPAWTRERLRADHERLRATPAGWRYALPLLQHDPGTYYPTIRDALLAADTPQHLAVPAQALKERLPGVLPRSAAVSAVNSQATREHWLPEFADAQSAQLWEEIVAEFWQIVADSQALPERRFRAAALLADYDPDDPRWSEAAFLVARQLSRENPLYRAEWAALFEPVQQALVEPLSRIALDPAEAAADRELATQLVAHVAGSQPDVLADLLVRAEPRQFEVLFTAVRPFASQIRPRLEQVIVGALPAKSTEVARDDLARRQANAAIALHRLGDAEALWPLLRPAEDPSVRAFIVHRASLLGVEPLPLAERLRSEPEAGIRRALLLALGSFAPNALPPAERETLVEWTLARFREDPDPGVHSAAEWLLRRWGQNERVRQLTSELGAAAPASGQKWSVNREGHTLAITVGPVEFRMGSPGLPNPELGRSNDEALHRRKIGRTFALATKEVTDEQFRRFLHANPSVNQQRESKRADDPTVPMDHVTWYEAAQYCRWLSELEGISEEQMCYPPLAEIKSGMTPPADYLERTGYRLPEEAEWEFACRAGTTTSHSYGGAEELLGEYAWFAGNAPARSQPVGLLKPNDLGLFDAHGNLAEWCHGTYFYFFGRGTQDVGDFTPLSDTSSRMLRGGSFASPHYLVRSADRLGYQPLFHFNYLGFRIARTIRPAEPGRAK